MPYDGEKMTEKNNDKNIAKETAKREDIQRRKPRAAQLRLPRLDGHLQIL